MKHARVKLNYLNCDGKRCSCTDNVKHEDGHPVAEFILIEDEADLQQYGELLERAATQQVVKCLHSPLFPDSVDHMLGARDMGSQLLAVAYYEASAHAISHPKPDIMNNPIYRIGGAALKKIERLRSILADGKIPIINNAGGYMWIGDGIDAEIVETYDKDPDTGAPKNVMRAGSKVVVLENDWDLPQESREYLYRTYGKTNNGQGMFSIVYDLRGHTHERLVAFLKEFKAKGGEKVFVYTTGLDVPQMFAYTDAILEAELSHLVLYVTGGTTDKHDHYFKKFLPALKIEVLEDLK